MNTIRAPFRSVLDRLLRLLPVVATLIALAVSATGVSASQSCCPMLAVDAPCHADALAACGTACSVCQTQIPAIGNLAAAVPNELRLLLPVGHLSIDQLAVRPAIPPPRGMISEA